jgi:hypothetical protein
MKRKAEEETAMTAMAPPKNRKIVSEEGGLHFLIHVCTVCPACNAQHGFRLAIDKAR